MDAKEAVKERIELYIEATGRANSVRDFLVRAGLSPSYLTGMSKGIGRNARDRIGDLYTDLNVAWLDTGEGSMLMGDTPPRVVSNVRPVLEGEREWVEIPLVPYRARAGVLSGFGDPDWLGDKQTMPVLLDKRVSSDYLIYEVAGDSMDDGSVTAFLEGDFLLCRILPQSDWQYGIKKRRDTFCIIATESEGVILKQITRHDKAEGTITCHSLNESYSDYDISLSEVKAIFYVEALAQRKL